MIKSKALVVVMCILIGCMIPVVGKHRTSGEEYTSPKVLQEYKDEIRNTEEELAKIKEDIAVAEKKADSYKATDDVKTETELQAGIDSKRMFIGYSNAEGSGVTVTMDDGKGKLKKGQDVNSLLVHEQDVLRVINDMKAAGAQVISVNSQRITANTSILCSGYTIRVNGKTYSRPFVIKALGDAKKIKNVLMSPSGYGTALKNWGIGFKVETAEHMSIAGYDKEKEIKYMQKLKGDTEQ